MKNGPKPAWSMTARAARSTSAHDVVHAVEPLGALPDDDGPRDVRSVAVDEPAEVEDDRLAGADPAVARVVVRRRCVGPGRDDREVDRLVAVRAKQVGELGRDILLG